MLIDNKMLSKFLSNVNVNIILTKYGKISAEWRKVDYVPSYNKLYYIKGGEGWVKIDGKEYFPKENHLVLLPEGVLQSFSSISKSAYEKYWCHFNARIGTSHLFDLMKIPFVINVHEYDRLDRLFEELIHYESSNDITASIMAKARLMEIICYMINHVNLDTSICNIKMLGFEKLNILVSYIEQNIHRNITVEELAQLVNLHPNYLISQFKKRFGLSPIKYINQRKITLAKDYLFTTNMSISDIADILGYNDVYYFSNTFKKAMGVCPSEYRSNH